MQQSEFGRKIVRRTGDEGDEVIEIPADIRDQLVAHAVSGLPNEACGLLAGRGPKAERFYPMRNADDSPATYRLDPKEQLDTLIQIPPRQ